MSVEEWNKIPKALRILVISGGSFLASIAAVSVSLATIEPWIPAHRQLLRDTIAAQAQKTKEALADQSAELKRQIAPTKIGVYDIQIGIAQARRSTINDQIFAAEISAPKSDSADELIKRRQQIQKLKDELSDVEAAIRLLRDQRERN
jgi:hypothetical protein